MTAVKACRPYALLPCAHFPPESCFRFALTLFLTGTIAASVAASTLLPLRGRAIQRSRRPPRPLPSPEPFSWIRPLLSHRRRPLHQKHRDRRLDLEGTPPRFITAAPPRARSATIGTSAQIWSRSFLVRVTSPTRSIPRITFALSWLSDGPGATAALEICASRRASREQPGRCRCSPPLR
jgi:hypothetical protein